MPFIWRKETIRIVLPRCNSATCPNVNVIIFAQQRDELLEYCLNKGIEAKVHYPIPIYRQPALKYLGLKEGDFPITDAHTKKIITFPCDQHLRKEEMVYVIDTVRDFYNR